MRGRPRLSATTAQIHIDADEVLLVAAYDGDEQAFEELFIRHYPRVYQVVIRIVGNHEDAEELAVDAFMQLYRQRLDPDRGVNLSGWLYRTATNAAFNRLRSRRRRRGWLERLATSLRGERPSTDDPADVVGGQVEADEVRRALGALPERQRNALALRAAGLKYAEIAEAIDVAPSSVGTIIARGERQLREVFLAEREAT